MGAMDDHWSTSSAPRVPRLRMTKVHIPFTFRVLDSSNSEPYNELRCAVSSRVAYSLLAFWAVPIIDLHRALWRPWPELRALLETLAYKGSPEKETEAENPATEKYCDCDKSCDSEKVSCEKCSYSDEKDGLKFRRKGDTPFSHAHRECRTGVAHEEKSMTLRPPWPGEPGPLGEPPRQDYPLVVLLKREDDQTENDLQSSDETVALVNVVHLRDPVCPLPTSMLGQYLKQSSGQLSTLKQLYLATPGDTNSANDMTQAQFSASDRDSTYSSLIGQPDQLCVVCQCFPLSRALLPCRHTCICAICFSKLDRCPMCRAPISSFFTIRAEDYIPQSAIPAHHTTRSGKGGAAMWLDALNDRLTDFLGFR
ncbi:uncharacterized protein LOC113369690 [Ctenocephalides felis]|uniref:uncharacterized protein LOC113369690 n=1 Tax=Ctenocephalides felis TaxID=7515 RepID=UPI000E6E4850|nr:uncharacterized protein LOC113369690 [Ctenocephalides felis]